MDSDGRPVALPGDDQLDQRVTLWISRVLRYGVIGAGSAILLGLALFLVRDPAALSPAALPDLLGRGQRAPLRPGDITAGLRAARPLAVIQLGLVLLILTPMARVLMTLLLFARQRDWAFTLITGVVLLLLTLGLVGVGG